MPRIRNLIFLLMPKIPYLPFCSYTRFDVAEAEAPLVAGLPAVTSIAGPARMRYPAVPSEKSTHSLWAWTTQNNYLNLPLQAILIFMCLQSCCRKSHPPSNHINGPLLLRSHKNRLIRVPQDNLNPTLFVKKFTGFDLTLINSNSAIGKSLILGTWLIQTAPTRPHLCLLHPPLCSPSLKPRCRPKIRRCISHLRIIRCRGIS